MTAIVFLFALFFIEETLPKQKRLKLNLKAVAKNYWKLITNIKYVAYSYNCIIAFAGFICYISTLSVIFINYLKIDLVSFSYYQASTMGTFIIFSLLSTKIIDFKGMDFTKNTGLLMVFVGSLGLFVTGKFLPTLPLAICIFMAIYAAGGALMTGTFGMKSMSVYPELTGTASSLITAIRQIITAGLVIISEIYFDGTITPIANILFVTACLAVVLYFIAENEHK